MRISKPILFSVPMVAAIMSGNKTQTRRAVKCALVKIHSLDGTTRIEENWQHWCPYGKIGGTLWLREEHYRFGHWVALPGVKTKTGKQKWAFIHDTNEVKYSDDPPTAFRISRHPVDHATSTWHKRLARFMPRGLCRINLEITDIRVEKLQSITEKDAMAEGAQPVLVPPDGGSSPHIEGFEQLWKKINGCESWDANVWVWAINFRRLL